MSARVPKDATVTGMVALIVPAGADAAPAVATVAGALRQAGLRVAGVAQPSRPPGEATRRPMELEDLATGQRLAISADRGPGAAGCSLDRGALMGAVAQVERALDAGAQVLILNKFGKTECEGTGFRALIGRCCAQDIPVLVPVPEANLAAWRSFAGDLAVEITLATGHDDRRVAAEISDRLFRAARQQGTQDPPPEWPSGLADPVDSCL